MAYLNCPHCRLALRSTSSEPMPKCPRCLAQAGVPMTLHTSEGPDERWSGWFGFVKPATR